MTSIMGNVYMFSVTEGFDSKGLGLRAQKKLLGKMSSKKIAKVFIDDTSARLLDNLYRLAKEYSGSKKTAEKLMKDIIKIVIKIGILYRNEQFSQEELQLAERFKKKFRTISMTVISFYEVDFSFDKHFLTRALNECSAMLKQLVENHLTEKSLGRIDSVFNFFTDPVFLETMFRPSGPYRNTLGKIVNDLHTMMDNGTL